MEMHCRRVPSFVLGLMIVGATCSVSAQNVLEEIVVTAQKREQNIQDVGIAITAFTGDQMRTLGITNSFDIANFAPGQSGCIPRRDRRRWAPR